MTTEMVRAITAENVEQSVTRAYAEANELKIVEGAPLYAHGRLRGPSRPSGRPIKPKAQVPAAIPTPPAVDEPADDNTDDGDAVADPKESK